MPRSYLPTTANNLIGHAPADLEGWVHALDTREIPVMAETACTLEVLRGIEDEVDAHLLVDELGQDPLFTLKLMRHVGMMHHRRNESGVETATEALVLLGIGPFFKAFPAQPTAEDHLQSWPEALEGLQMLMRRSHRAAQFALAFALHRQDTDAAVIYQATLLHDLAEMLLWLHAPVLAQAWGAQVASGPSSLNNQAHQLAILNVELAELQQALMAKWGLQQLLREISDDHPSERHQVLNVQLAVRLAHHSSASWTDERLQADIQAIAQLLGLAFGPCAQMLRDLDS